MHFSIQLQQKISQAIGDVERLTDAEVVCVLAPRSDDYYYIPALWAALIALVSPLLLVLTPWWGLSSAVSLLQLFVFVVSWLLLRWQPLFQRIIPKTVRYWRASNMARRQFLENDLHHTQEGSGLLIFVSAQERYVEILADRGIAQKIDDDQWQEIVSAFVHQVKHNQIEEGFIECIQSCGNLLTKHYPATTSKNELPNKLIVLPD
ncbi:TPM domain-containing protein [Neptunomonas phycophila]|jgi:putative membrane protein|uniref:TPM domain-containing protein n=1 Tax=Neptunomonas phycophila TaxID=1572645 RepID=UPI003511E008